MTRTRLAAVAWALVAASCGGSDDATCVEGHQTACACPGGRQGVQVCTAEGKYGPCQCPEGPDGGTPLDSALPPDSGAQQHDTGSGGEHAPVILSLSTNSQTLTELDTLVVTAVVTDPDGIDDLIGGRLLDKDTGGTYGSFVSSAQEGSYQISLTLDQVATVHPLEGETVPVIFVAEFFDQAGHTARGEVQVQYRCSEQGLWFCSDDLECHDVLSNSYRCGDCQTRCTGDFDTCMSGHCVDVHWPSSGSTTCDTLCARYGETCVVARDENDHEIPCSQRGAYECGCVADPNCAGNGPENTVARCTDGCSNDGDRYVDCDDYDCCDVVNCPQGTACNP